jgi:nucleotide-binding universal stress UspA family protein
VYQKILAAIDESPIAERVLATARDLAALTDAEI